jgi:type IV secretory pathway VirB2 component (pilin)
MLNQQHHRANLLPVAITKLLFLLTGPMADTVVIAGLAFVGVVQDSASGHVHPRRRETGQFAFSASSKAII